MSTSRLAVVITLAAIGGARSGEAQATVTVRVDLAAARRSIDPRIYGVSWAGSADFAALNLPMNRWGGNATTRYNWRANTDNRAADWFFESIPYASATEGAEADAFVSATRSGGAQPMVTIPVIGWVARTTPGREKLASFSVAKYGAQTSTDGWFPDAGNGVSAATGQDISGNDPNDASVLVDSSYQTDWVRHLVSRFGTSTAGGVRYYILDNEPSIWWETHRDVAPVGVTMEDIRDRMIAHALGIKSVDPGAVVLGPEEWGWVGYFYSGYDHWHASLYGWGNFPDRNAHGGADVLPWLLDQMKLQEQHGGERLLDVLSVHYYPQGGETGDDVSAAMQARRNRSTRSLWDPSYVDESWINDTVRLVPRMRGWIAGHYPGTRFGVTEYSWGADGHINGATAQADVLGIFGREGVDLANRWVSPQPGTPVYKAFQIYRNYDGRRSTFGEVSVLASAPQPDQLAAFAAERARDHALTVMLVNKTGAATTSAQFAHFAAAPAASVYQLTSANVISRLADVPVSGSQITVSLPAQSITLLVIPHAARVTSRSRRTAAAASGAAFRCPCPRPTIAAS